MARPNESAVQRIQVGVLGLLGVLLFVYIANLIVDRVAPPSPRSAEASRQAQPEAPPPKDEPLAELGVTPAVEDSKQTAPKSEPGPAR